MSNWIAGWNQPGCLPDTTERPAEFSDWLTAQQWLMNELEIDPGYTASVQAAWYALSRAEPDQPFGYRTNDPLLVWWIEPALPDPQEKAEDYRELRGDRALLIQEDMEFLQYRAEEIAELLDDQPEASGPDHHLWQVHDPMRSSSGQEYVMSPASAGFYGVAGDRFLRVEITFVTDQERLEELRNEFL